MIDYKKRIETAKKTLRKSDILPENINHILNFLDQLSAEDISKVRQLKYLFTLKKLAELLSKDFTFADKNDIKKLIRKIKNPLDSLQIKG
jgi:regulator of sigma D